MCESQNPRFLYSGKKGDFRGCRLGVHKSFYLDFFILYFKNSDTQTLNSRSKEAHRKQGLETNGMRTRVQ